MNHGPTNTDAQRHHLLAILAADVAGYSRLMSLDDKATVAALDVARAVFREHILAHHGRVIDMVGDAVLAAFDSAVGAVDSALAIQQQLADSHGDIPEDRRMRFRIGIHLGDVIEKSDGTVYGDGVNIAARLEGLAEPGGVTISQSVQNAVFGKVQAQFEDTGEQTVKNIVQPVRAYRVRPGAAQTIHATTVRNSRRRRLALTAAALLILVVGIGAWHFLRPAGLTVTTEVTVNPLSIMVLPFANQTGDPNKAHIADGLTSSLSADLNRIRDAFVVPTATAFTYKDKPMTVQQVGKDAAVRFVLQGSVLANGDQLRVSAQLVDTLNGRQLWNETFEGNVGKLFELQDQVTTRTGNSIGEKMVIEAARASETHASSPTVADLMLRVRALDTKPQSRENYEQQEVLLKAVLQQEPNHAQALGSLSATMALRTVNFENGDKAAKNAMLEEAHRLASRAQAMDENLPIVNVTFALHAQYVLRDLELMRRFMERRIALEPKNPYAYNNLSVYFHEQGDARKAIELLNQALALYPKGDSTIFFNLCRANLMLGDNQAAVEWGQRATDAGDRIPYTPAYMAMALANLGQIEKAHRLAAEYKRRLADAGARDQLTVLDGTEVPAYVKYFNERLLGEATKAGLL